MSEMEKTPGQILYESVYLMLFWSDQDEETRAIYEKDAAAVIAHYEATEVAGLRAQLAQVQEELERVRTAAAKVVFEGLAHHREPPSLVPSESLRDTLVALRAALTPTTPKEAEHDPE